MSYKLALAGMLVTMAMYVQIPLLPVWMSGVSDCTNVHMGMVMGLPGIGVFALGCFCSYLVQRYRRNMVCVAAVLLLGMCIYAVSPVVGDALPSDFIQVGDNMRHLVSFNLNDESVIAALVLLRFIQGAVFGLVQIVLSSTLVIDACESSRRTYANHRAAWFSRFALPLGPLSALLIMQHTGQWMVIIYGVVLCLVAAMLIMSVKFPFKAPEDVVRHVSTDRFILLQGKWMFVNLVLFAIVVGLMFSVMLSDKVYFTMLIPGFLAALSVERFIFSVSHVRVETIIGMMLVVMSLAVMLFDFGNIVSIICHVAFGCGIGMVASRFLLMLVGLSPHCRRGTSQSTFFLACQCGLGLGLFGGFAFFYEDKAVCTAVSLLFACASMLMYFLFTRKWYLAHVVKVV